jgi:photosystem II stability/assembly factor-like uncharacterized protein
MKNFIIILLYLLLFPCIGNSQWQTYNLSHNGVAYCMDFYNINTGVVCGHTLFPFNEKPYYTINSGVTWLPAQCPPAIRAVSEVQFINAMILYATGAENLVILNRGINETALQKYLPDFIKRSIVKIGRTGFTTEYEGAFLKSTNAGVSWQKVTQFDSLTGYLMDLHFFNESTGYVIADSSNIGNSRVLKTTNGGINWQTIRVEPILNLRKLLFLNESTGFVCGFKNYDTSVTGVLFRTTNAGLNWIKTSFDAGEELKDICFTNQTTGIAICQGPYDFKIYKTVNSGVSLDLVNYFQNVLEESINTIQGTGIVFINGTVDSSSYFKTFTAKSTDYGLSWEVKYFYWNEEIIHSRLIDLNTWFMCGGNADVPAVVLKSTNGGTISVNNISTNVPGKYILYQNYPNPFNPVTSIKYDIVFTDNVNIKIFDISGKEVAEPVNEKLSPGTYNLIFDASDLASGVYIYRITTNNYTGIKKMVHIK